MRSCDTDNALNHHLNLSADGVIRTLCFLCELLFKIKSRSLKRISSENRESFR